MSSAATLTFPGGPRITPAHPSLELIGLFRTGVGCTIQA